MNPRIFLYDIRIPGALSGPAQVGRFPVETLSRYVEHQIKEITDEVYQLRRDYIYSPAVIEPAPYISATMGIIDYLVVRLDARVNWKDFPDLVERVITWLKARHKRNPETAHWLLYSSNYDFHLDLAWSPERQPLDPVAALQAIKMAELDAALEDEHVIYHHSKAAYFRLPSGELSDFFLRVGNLQRHSNLLEMLTFWSLPYLTSCTHILAETWSISTTAAYFAEFLKNYDVDRTAISWSYLGAYLPTSLEEQSRLKALTREIYRAGGQTLVLISASGTGRLRNFVLDLASETAEPAGELRSVDTLTLLTIRSDIEHGNAVYDASKMLENNGLEGVFNDINEHDVNIVEINPETYFPDYRLREIGDFSAIDHPEPTRRFFECYSGHGIFCVCRRGKTRVPERHHSFYIDFLKLNAHPAFSEALRNKVREIGAADVVIVRNDESSQAFLSNFRNAHFKEFGDYALREYTVDRFVKVSESTAIARLLMDPALTVVFIDPVFITGGHIRDLAISVRENVTRGLPARAKIRHLVGLFRPETEIKERYGRRFYPRMSNHDGFNAKLIPVEEVKLPNWNEAECPWIIELAKHEKLFTDPDLGAAEKAYIESRINSIKNGMANGLRGPDVFFKRYPQDCFRFFYGSFFLDSRKVIERNAEFGIKLLHESIDYADIVCAVAAAFQEWRESNKKRRPAFYQLRPLPPIKPEIVGDQNGFNEPALRAAIWRCLKTSEIALDRSDNDLAETLAHIYFGDDEHHVLGGEAALAFGNDLPRILGVETFQKIDWLYLKQLAGS